MPLYIEGFRSSSLPYNTHNSGRPCSLNFFLGKQLHVGCIGTVLFLSQL